MTTNSNIINKRKIINGEDDGLMQVYPLKHPFAMEMWHSMLENTWTPGEVSLQSDINQWGRDNILTDNERRVYKRSLAFVSNLDGIQTGNLILNISRQITSPEVTLAICRQAFEEALHVHSYSTMIEALGLNPDEIYGMYRHDVGLYSKNQYVLSSLKKISPPLFKTGTLESDQDFLEACYANIILEGIYFYSAFLNFYALARQNKMTGSSDMIKLINRDEEMHLRLFLHIVTHIRLEQPELFTEEFKDKIVANFEGACQHEIEWGRDCIQDGIAGITPDNLEKYIKFITDVRLRQCGLPALYNISNPFLWIDDFTQGAVTEANFFERTVTEYATGTLDWS